MFNKGINYNLNALLQKEIAFDLVKMAEVEISNSKNILDLGCGTGFVSRFVKSINPATIVDGVDISRSQLIEAKPFYNELWQEDISIFTPSKKYDIILSSMCLQWVKNKNDVISKYSPFFFTLPTQNSLQEIIECFAKINLPSPILKFEIPCDLKPFYTKIYTQKFESLLKALKHFHSIGAVKKQDNKVKISHNQVREMEKHFAKTLTWEVAFFKNNSAYK